LARSWRFGTASGIARLASLLATRHESHHRIHSALAVRQGFRHRATRFAPRDSARIPPPYSFGLGGSAGLRHRATRFAHRDSARIPASLATDSPILVAPQWPVSTAASSWQSNTRAPQVPMLAERRQSPREPHECAHPWASSPDRSSRTGGCRVAGSPDRESAHFSAIISPHCNPALTNEQDDQVRPRIEASATLSSRPTDDGTSWPPSECVRTEPTGVRRQLEVAREIHLHAMTRRT